MKLSDGLHNESPGDSPERCAVSDLACQRCALAVTETPVELGGALYLPL